jgi:hypothetical protein
VRHYIKEGGAAASTADDKKITGRKYFEARSDKQWEEEEEKWKKDDEDFADGDFEVGGSEY